MIVTHTQTQGADGAGTKTAGELWGVEENDRFVWVGIMRPDGSKIDHIVYHIDMGGYTPEAKERRRADARRIVAAVNSTPAPAATPGVLDSVRALLEAAYDAGFAASGEGWNGEHPGDHKGDGDYEGPKRDYLDAIIAAQPAGQAGDAGAITAEAVEAAAATYYDAMMGEAPHTYGWAGKPEAFKAKVRERMALALSAALRAPAPNSTRTGAAETEVLREAVSKALHDNQFLDGWPEMVDPVVEAVLAARLEAPSDAGCAEIEDRLSEILTASQRQDLSDRLLSAYMAPHGGLRLDNAEVAYLWTKLGGSLDLPTSPSDPAPSGQAEG